MVGGIWGQTRSYGDIYHRVLHVGTVASVCAMSVFFRGVSRGRGTKSRQICPSPATQSFVINGRKHRIFGRQATLVTAGPLCEDCGLRRDTNTAPTANSTAL